MLKLSKHLYMSTITSFTKNDMIKVDVCPGDYKLMPFEEGYIFSNTTVDLEKLDLVKIFADRDGDKGLSGTYYGGESEDPNQLRLYRTWLYKHFELNDMDEYYEPFIFYESYEFEDEDDYNERIERRKRELFKYDAYEARTFNFEEYNNYNFHAAEELDIERRRKTDPKYIKSFNCYHNLPFLFYLNKEVSNFDDVHLVETHPVDSCGYLWKVYEGEEHIGYVVQKELHFMSGDQAGIAMFEGAHAFGNFNYDYNLWADLDAGDSRFGYICKFDNCECDTQYEYIIKRNEMRKKKMAQLKEMKIQNVMNQ